MIFTERAGWGRHTQSAPRSDTHFGEIAVVNNCFVTALLIVALIGLVDAVGAPITDLLPASLGVHYNGSTSCHRHGLVLLPKVISICVVNGGPCFGNVISMNILASKGDSGSLVVTEIGNNPVGMLFSTNGTTAYMIPIAQVIKDTGLSVIAGSSPGVRTAQATKSLPLPALDLALRKAIADNGWVAKLPHVTGVSYGLVGNEPTIVVYVDKAENVSEVERKVPSKLEGFPVEVTEPPTVNYL
jgi:hypothetical protein